MEPPFNQAQGSTKSRDAPPSRSNSGAATATAPSFDTSPASTSGISPSQARTSTSSTPSSSNNRIEIAAESSSPTASGSKTATVPLAGKRSRSGCLTCRKRKKKCDETLCEETGGCWRCRNAGYQCEGFRRPPVVFEPGSAANVPKSKRTKTSRSPEASRNGRIKTEAGSSTDAVASSSGFDHASFTSLGSGTRSHSEAHQQQPSQPTIDQESLDMANSLAEFAGLATSSAGWPLVPNLSAGSSASATAQEDQGSNASLSFKNGPSGTPPSYQSFVHSSAMLPPIQPHSPQRSMHQQHQQDQSLHQPQSSATPHVPAPPPLVPCEIVGDCLFSGHHLCASCSAVANRLMQPDPAQLAALDAHLVQVQPMPSLSTPVGSRHHSPSATQPDSTDGNNNATQHAHAKSRLVMESLIGYYSTLITCWTQGCDVRGLEASPLFRKLVPYLLDSVDSNPPLRLSIAAVTAGYVGGARLTWPKDVVAIHQWANTLRADRTSIADCVKANLSFPFPSTPDTISSASPAGSLASETHASATTGLSPANAERLRRASSTHATLDDLLVGQAQTLKQLAVRSLEQAASDYRSKTTRALGVSFTEKGFLTELRHLNPLLLAATNIAIYAFAEEGMESYFEEAARMRGLIDTLLGSFPPVDLSKLTSHEHLAFRTYVWSDVSTAISCGIRPHLQLALSTYAPDSDVGMAALDGASPNEGPLDVTFSLHDAVLVALSDIARLRYDFDGGDFSATARRQAGSPVPQWVHDRARRIQSRVESVKIEGSLATGSAICAIMTKSACAILIHSLIYRVGALHPVIKGLLKGMLELWTSAGEQYCRSVGCSNFNLPIFIAASVAVREEDRKVCEQAMQIVGHEEAGPASGRALIREVWRRTDVVGVPCFWTDLIATGEYAVAFF